MSREFLMAVKESAFTTPKSTPVVWTTSTTYGLANADAYYCRLAGPDMFTVRGVPTGTVYTPYGGGVAITASATSDKQAVSGRLTMPLSISQAPFWLSWACQQINTGQTAPWTTTEPAGDLASIAIYHGIVLEDFTVKRNVYLGCKCMGFDLSISEDSTILMLSLDILASKYQGNSFDSSSDPSSGTFPVPADNNLPTDWYVYSHLGATAPVIGGTSRAKISSIAFSSKNALDSKFYANRFLQLIRFMGRQSDVSAGLAFDGTPFDRSTFQALASEGASFSFGNGTHSFSINMNAQNVFESLDDKLGLANIYMQASKSRNMWDPTAGSDFTISFT